MLKWSRRALDRASREGQDAIIPSRSLFQPLRIGRHITIPNRFLMQPLYMNMEHEIDIWSEDHMSALSAFFGERAHYGAKLIVMGGLAPSLLGTWKANAMVLGTFDAAKALRQVTHAVHEEGGYVLAQAFHSGRASHRQFYLSSTNVASAITNIEKTHPMRIPGFLINYVVTEYQRFARLAEEAGFDGVEIPLSEGTLLHNFISPSVNDRHDAFGGSLAHRVEFVVRVLETIKAQVKEKDRFVVSVRLCLHDLKPEKGTPLAETLQIATLLAQSGWVDLINTSVGMHDSYVQTLSSFVPQAAFARGCQLLKQRLAQEGLAHIPVVASHRIHSVAVAERLMEQQVCDLVGIGRPLLADPQFIQKAEEKRADDILPCIGCNHCVNRLYTTQRVTCALNPIAGYELDRSWLPSPYKKSVAVVGAGAAGVTCALTLWRRGHDVTLYEKGKFIGGQLNWAKMIPGKESYQDILEYWTRQLRASSINILTETDFTREEMTKQHNFFHAVVLATGSIPKPYSSHKYPGASECRIVVPFERILDGSVRAGRRVVILGNGAIAHDVASYLLHDQRVSRSIDYFLDEWGVNMEDGSLLSPELSAQRAPRNNRDVVLFNKIHYDSQLSRGTGWSQKLWIRRHGGTIIKNATVNNIDKDGVHVSTLPPLPEKYVVPCDTIVWCQGMLPNISVGTWIYEWKKDGADERGEMVRDFSIYVAGSCRDASTGEGRGEEDLMRAVQEGYEIGYKV